LGQVLRLYVLHDLSIHPLTVFNSSQTIDNRSNRSIWNVVNEIERPRCSQCALSHARKVHIWHFKSPRHYKCYTSLRRVEGK